MANVKRVVSGLFLLSGSWGLGGALDDGGLHLRTGCTSPGAYRFDLETLSLVAEAKWGPCAGWAPCEAGYFCGEDGVRRPCPPGGYQLPATHGTWHTHGLFDLSIAVSLSEHLTLSCCWAPPVCG